MPLQQKRKLPVFVFQNLFYEASELPLSFVIWSSLPEFKEASLPLAVIVHQPCNFTESRKLGSFNYSITFQPYDDLKA